MDKNEPARQDKPTNGRPGKKLGAPVRALALVLGGGICLLMTNLSYISLFFLVFGALGTVILPITGFVYGVGALNASIRLYREDKDRTYLVGIVISGLAVALPVLAVVLPVLLLSTGVIHISLM